MQRAGLGSDKPIDVFKIKAKDKGKPEPAAQHAAYGALVVTQKRAGLYAMPCAAAGRRSPCRDLTTRCAKARADFKSLTFSIFWSA